MGGAVEDHPNRNIACEIISLEHMQSACVMCDDIDEVSVSARLQVSAKVNHSYRQVNIAQFLSIPGQGVVYGTKRGKVRSFTSHRDGTN